MKKRSIKRANMSAEMRNYEIRRIIAGGQGRTAKEVEDSMVIIGVGCIIFLIIAIVAIISVIFGINM